MTLVTAVSYVFFLLKLNIFSQKNFEPWYCRLLRLRFIYCISCFRITQNRWEKVIACSKKHNRVENNWQWPVDRAWVDAHPLMESRLARESWLSYGDIYNELSVPGDGVDFQGLYRKCCRVNLTGFLNRYLHKINNHSKHDETN